MNFLIKPINEYICDVAVVGGGTAGVFAAVAAAKSGAKTILVEKNSRLGGTMTSASVNFPGLFFAWGKQIIDGPCWEAVKAAIALGGAQMPKISFKPEKHWYEQIRVNKLIYTYVLHKMCKENGINLITNAMLAYAAEEKSNVNLLAACKEGTCLIKAKKAVDATGDANLAVILGYPCIKSRVQQPATLQNHLSGYNICEVNINDIRKALSHLSEFNSSESITEDRIIHYLTIGKLDIHTQSNNADTSAGKGELEYNALCDLVNWYKFLRSIKGLENLTIDFIAEETGVRETNRIKGEYEITAEDYLSGILYDDSVCYSFYPIDLHVENGIEQSFLKENVVPKIPYRALIPHKSKNIICAGRMISSDRYANSALRVQASCMAMGQAAGCAAAIASLTDTCISDINYKQLCCALEKIGAIVPNE